MNYFDVFNGDADGICALHQMRLANPVESTLITGVKRDISLLKKVQAAAGDQILVLDISLDKNRDDLERLLKLDIPEDQKWDVVREFINLKEEHRQKYIEELENVNRKISEKLISRVMVMKIDDVKKEGLIKQLELMTPNNQQDFVEYLESNE